ncbi:MAG TPA: histidine kinase [Burkholderiaceae bacterium]|nr:histidine kinase [Burkholderiaceae bacterium]
MPLRSTVHAASSPRKIVARPDYCNLGIVLRVLVGLHVGALMFALPGAASWREAFDQFLVTAAVLAPSALVGLCALCVVVKRLGDGPEWHRLFAGGAIAAIAVVLADLLVASVVASEDAVRSRWFHPLALMAFASLVGVAIVRYHELRARALSPALSEARLQALQSRIRPHFLFNSLNAAMSLVRSDPVRAESVLSDMADLFRMLMGDSRARISLDEEVALARQYLAIEQVRLGDRLRVEWAITRLPPKLLVPPLLLQPLLENAVRHGIEPVETPGLIAVRITGMASEVVIVVENSYAPGAERPGNGIALTNVRERLMLMYDLEAKMRVSADGRLYRVVLTLPMREEGA